MQGVSAKGPGRAEKFVSWRAFVTDGRPCGSKLEACVQASPALRLCDEGVHIGVSIAALSLIMFLIVLRGSDIRP